MPYHCIPPPQPVLGFPLPVPPPGSVLEPSEYYARGYHSVPAITARTSSTRFSSGGVKVSLSARALSGTTSLDLDVLHLIWTVEKLEHQLNFDRSTLEKRCPPNFFCDKENQEAEAMLSSRGIHGLSMFQ
uniref:Uncharacterized protein n=1 Tax=Solanum lycopersicum TaxID=4081 RepID=A0A3Q7FE57_SOLLC